MFQIYGNLDICTLKAIEVIKKVKKRKKYWLTGLRHLNTLCEVEQEMETDEDDATRRHLVIGPKLLVMAYTIYIFYINMFSNFLLEFMTLYLCKWIWRIRGFVGNSWTALG